MVNYYAEGGTVVTTTASKSLAFPKVAVADIFETSAKITAQDSTTETTTVFLYKRDEHVPIEQIPIMGYRDDGWIVFAQLQEYTEYLAVFDYNDGRYNAINFIPRGAYIWARIGGIHKKGVVWVKVDGVWKRAKAVFCRKTTNDNWKRGM